MAVRIKLGDIAWNVITQILFTNVRFKEKFNAKGYNVISVQTKPRLCLPLSFNKLKHWPNKN